MRTLRNRSKLMAGFGVLAMLLGAVMVLAPSAGAHDEQGNLEQGELVPTIYSNKNAQCNTNAQSEQVLDLGYDFGESFSSAPGDPVNGIDFTTGLEGDVLHFYWTSTIHDIEAISVKQGDGSAVFSPLPDGSQGTVYVATSSDLTQFSHIEFCWNDQETTPPGLKVEKVVSGTAPSNAVYQIDVTRGETLIDDNEPISPSTPYTTTGAGTYDIDEVATGGASSVSWACFQGTSTTASSSGTGTSIDDVVVDTQDVRCVFTNTFTTTTIETVVTTTTTIPPTGAIQIIKAVTGDVPEDGWSYDFTGDLGSFSLDNVSPSNTEVDLDPGEYTVTEVPDDVATLEDITCEGGTADVDLAAGSVTVILSDDSSVTCTFTNDYPDVEPSVVTRPTTTVAPTVPPTVLPDVVTLPRTGDEDRKLVGAGLLLLGAGFVLVARGSVLRTRAG